MNISNLVHWAFGTLWLFCQLLKRLLGRDAHKVQVVPYGNLHLVNVALVDCFDTFGRPDIFRGLSYGM
jgi:hypothetical protein